MIKMPVVFALLISLIALSSCDTDLSHKEKPKEGSVENSALVIDDKSYDEYMLSKKYKRNGTEGRSYSRSGGLYENPDGYEIKDTTSCEIKKGNKKSDFYWQIENYESPPFNFKANVTDAYGKEVMAVIKIIRTDDNYEIAKLVSKGGIEYSQSIGHVNGCSMLYTSSRSDRYEISIEEIHYSQNKSRGNDGIQYKFGMFNISIKDSENENIREEAKLLVSINSKGETSTAFEF